MLWQALLQQPKKLLVPPSPLHLPAGDGCPHSSGSRRKDLSVGWKLSKVGIKLLSSTVLVEQPLSFQISFVTSGIDHS